MSSEYNINHVNKWVKQEPIKREETTAEKEARYAKWKKEHQEQVWEIRKPKPIDFTIEDPILQSRKNPNHPLHGNQYVGMAVEPEHERPAGSIVYTPHDCERPDAELLRIGTIWECHDYTKKNPEGRSQMCYDQWIVVVDKNGNRRWQLFKRSF